MRPPAIALFLIGLALPATLVGQSAMAGGVSGRVQAPGRGVVPNAVVTLSSGESGLSRVATTDLRGSYSFSFVAPARYELRVEALGYRPVVVVGLDLEGGSQRTVHVSLTEEPPPVTAVDTIGLSAATASRWRVAGPLVSGADMDRHREIQGDLGAVTRLASEFDPFLGALGLPEEMTGLFVDGIPFFAARHPLVRGANTGTPAFPASSLTRATLRVHPDDVQWLGVSGAILSAESRAGASGGVGSTVEGGWSGGPLWSSGLLDVDAPTLSSYRAAIQGSIDLVPDTSRLFVGGEAVRQQAPTLARMPLALAEAASGLDPLVVEGLTNPSVETYSRYSGVARLDRWGPTSRFSLRAAAGRAIREYDGNGPGSIGYGVVGPEEATDLSAGAALTAEVRPGYTLEFLGGISASDRTFGVAGASPSADLVAPGVHLGGAAGGDADAARLDVHLSPALHFRFGAGTVKAGATVHAARHTITSVLAGNGDIFFTDFAGLAGRRGAFADGTSVESTFATSRMGVFAQYAWEPAPGLRVVAGGRVDVEKVPTSGAALNTDWVNASGVVNDSFPSRFIQPAGVLAATWDVRGDQRTIMFGNVAMSNGSLDPRLVHEAFTQDGTASVSRYVGTGVEWPAGAAPGSARRTDLLTLLGPDTRPPRSAHVSAGLIQDLGSGWSLRAEGALRRTDFLPRRRDLNLPFYPLATDDHGRDIVGDLTKIGSLVAAAPGTGRRFEDFDAVWAVDPDGWSRYRSATLGLSHTASSGDAFVSYTWSETRDNWMGAALGLADAAMDPRLPEGTGIEWSEGVSDFDAPHRLVAGATVRLDFGAGSEISAVYRFASGQPFTPGYRAGVDANGDGSMRNDVAFVPDLTSLDGLAGGWSCLTNQLEQFAARNSCRGPARQSLDAGIRLGLTSLSGRTVSLTVEGFNLIEDESGVLDRALLLVSPDAPLVRSGDGSTVTLPVTVNPDFGKVVFPSTRGRILRVGLRIGG
jgi:hypothetical protein